MCDKRPLTLALSLSGRGLVGGGHTEGTLGTVAAGADTCLPLATGAGSDLSGGLEVVTSGHNAGSGECLLDPQVGGEASGARHTGALLLEAGAVGVDGALDGTGDVVLDGVVESGEVHCSKKK